MNSSDSTDAAAVTGGQGTVRLDRLRPADAIRCAELERVLFPGDDPWTELAFLDELRAGNHFLAARLDGMASPDPARPERSRPGAVGPVYARTTDRLVGYAGLAFTAGPPQAEAEIHTIGVDPALHGRGIGRALLRGLLRVTDAAGATVFLEVRTDNAVAVGLYGSERFTVVGLRKRYYRPSGADAYTMRRDPGPAAPTEEPAS